MSVDDTLAAHLAALPVPEFAVPLFVTPPPLSEATVADETMSTIRLDSGPAAAAALRQIGVDVVLLTPV